MNNKNPNTIASIENEDTPNQSFAPPSTGLDLAGRPTTDAISVQDSKGHPVTTVGVEPEAFSSYDEASNIELIEEYEAAQFAFDKAKARFDLVKDAIRARGTFTEGDYQVSVSVINRTSVSLKDIEKYSPDLFKELNDRGLITKSESERLSVKLKPRMER